MPTRSHGAVLLERTSQSQEVIAEATGVSRVAVSHWKNGATKPKPDTRTILAEKFGIPVDAWDEDADAARAKTDDVSAPETDPPFQVPEGVLGKARLLEQMLYELLMKARADGGMLPLERAKVMASCTQTLAHLAKITGQYELGSRLFKLPVWKRIEQAIEKALTPHPDAAAALAAELRALDRDNTYE